MPDQDDMGPAGPAQPPGYEDISIEFVESHDGDDQPPAGAVPSNLQGPETGILEIPPMEPESREAVGRELELANQVAKLEEQILRRRADFENYRRRQDRERDELARQATARVVEALLPALDDLDRAVDGVRQEVSEDHLQGLLLVRRQIFETLGRMGVEEIDALGQPFDPAFHEAVCMAARSDVPPMTITTVFQKGYTLGGKLLKPSKVEINSGAPAGEQGAADA
jgi:molecular chaperone GrpE